MSMTDERSLPGNDPGVPDLLLDIVIKLLREASRSFDQEPEVIRSAIRKAAELLTTAADRGPPGPNLVRGGLAPWQVRQVRAYVDAHLGEAIMIEDLQALTRLSISYFSTAFRRTFGETPHEYLSRRRIARAQEMMLMTDEPLSQIALACGLCDQAHLSKLFRRLIGVSPNAWRRQCRGVPGAALAA